MTRTSLTVFFILLGSVALAQINDAEAIARARLYAGRLAPEVLSQSPRVEREEFPDAPGGPTQFVRVDFGDVILTLLGDGSLAGYSNFGAVAPVTGGADRYRDDEDAWRALESVLHEVGVADGLARKALVRASNDMRPNEVNFAMAARPYGYESDGGNVAHAVVHRVTGRIVSLYVGKGWQYEPPNIVVSEETAINNVRLVHGGNAGEWNVSMRYATFADSNAPEHVRQMRSEKTMRLHYVLHSPSIGTAFVDSVTGDIVHFGSTENLGAGSVPRPAMKPSKGVSTQDQGNGDQAGGPWQSIALCSAVLLVACGAVVYFRRLRAS